MAVQQAQQAAQATAVASTVIAPLVGAGNGVLLGTTIDQAIASLHDHFGKCVTTARNVTLNKGQITATYTDCTGPFEALTFSGSSTATFAGDSATQKTHLQISDMTFCADGSACVQGVELQGPDRKVSLDLSPGGGGTFSFSGPILGQHQGSLPAGTELCLRP